MKNYADIAKRRATVNLSVLMPADVAEYPPHVSVGTVTKASRRTRRTA